MSHLLRQLVDDESCHVSSALRCRPAIGDIDEVWISSLQVCEALRRQGLGRELVQAVEAMARTVGAPSIRVYPLTNAVRFWESLGYRPDSNIARALRKDLVDATAPRST